MRNKQLLKMVAGFRRFRERIFLSESSIYSRGDLRQSPKTLVIGCSDSRVDPAILTSASPGELFVVRNVANLVPPFETGGGFHGVSAAIEFAVVNLQVENIVVLGHRQCGGIQALVTGSHQHEESFLGRWVTIAEPAKDRVLKIHPHADTETLCRHCELESIVTSLENLRTFPFVKEAIAQRSLLLFGIYFDLEKGELLEFDEGTTLFKQVPITTETGSS